MYLPLDDLLTILNFERLYIYDRDTYARYGTLA